MNNNSPDTRPGRTSGPSRLRQVVGAVAGVGTATSIYGIEGYFSWAMLEVLRAGYQSPDRFASGVSIVCLLGLMGILVHDTTQNQGQFTLGMLTSGARAGLAVNEAITGA